MDRRLEKISWIDLAKRYIEEVLGKRPDEPKFPVVTIKPENNLYLEAARLLADRFGAPASYPPSPYDDSAKIYSYKTIEPLTKFLSTYSLEKIERLINQIATENGKGSAK